MRTCVSLFYSCTISHALHSLWERILLFSLATFGKEGGGGGRGPLVHPPVYVSIRILTSNYILLFSCNSCVHKGEGLHEMVYEFVNFRTKKGEGGGACLWYKFFVL